LHNGKTAEFLASWLVNNSLCRDDITFFDCDLMEVKANLQKFSNLLERFSIDVLVNNAGITEDVRFLKMSFQQWNKVLQVNLVSLFGITQGIAKQMALKGSGTIINISSINGLKGQFGQANYSASKAGVIGFTKALAQELASSGVRVNAIAPGYTSTPMVKKLSPEILNSICADIPIKQLADVDDIANTVLFLTQDIPSLT
jgi:acetoacetyl-CoA reductase